MIVLATFLAISLQASAPASIVPSNVERTSKSHDGVIVQSTYQQSGVTAGHVDKIEQILPSLVRGPQLAALKAIFVKGAVIRRRNNRVDITDDDIDKFGAEAQQWADSTYDFLASNVSEYAAERFAFRPTGATYSYALPGSHADGQAQKWGQLNEGLSTLMVNLDQLMRDPSIYPE